MGKIAQQDTLLELLKATKNPIYEKDFQVSVEEGLVEGWLLVRKFGRIVGCSTSLTPITASGTYQTPTSATTVEIVSDNVNDIVDGTGAQQVTVIGLDSTWSEISEIVSMNGVGAVTLANKYTRIYRAYVNRSGTYGTASASSQAGTITIKTSGGGVTWITLTVVGSFGLGQSLCGAYTIPRGYTAYVFAGYASVETAKAAILYFFNRTNIDTIATPYNGVIRVTTSIDLAAGFSDFGDQHILGVFPEKTDIGWMGQSSASTANISVEFRIYLKKNLPT